tara:strand:- start:2360 stop:2569 length:210 start_codon:yes stop_codon:yes gene_type:complete
MLEAQLTALKKFTRDMAADYLCRSKRTLEKWQERNFGPPFYRDGRHTYYPLDDLIAWREAQMKRRGGGQ